MIAGSAITVVATLVLVATRLQGRHGIAAAAKVAASCGFLWTAWAAGALEAGVFGAWIFIGLVFGWFGDVFLLARDSKRLFMAGLVSFLLGHLAYVVAIAAHGFSIIGMGAALVVLLAGGAQFRSWLGPNVTGAMRWGVVAYIGVISVMLAAGLSTYGREGFWVLMPASVLFYLSDIGVALDRFKPGPRPAYRWGLPLYYGGQLLFAWSIRLAF